MRDSILVGGMILAFATLVTSHVAIVLALTFRHPRWHAAVALLLPPLAPYWALREGMPLRGCIWVGSVVLYSVLLALTTF